MSTVMVEKTKPTKTVPEKTVKPAKPATKTVDESAALTREKRQAVDLALSQIEKQFGKGAT